MIRVLVVEDETPIQRDICRKLEQYSDEFKVVARASTGEEAVHLLEQIKIDVAFIDVNIPILNGLEVIRHINQLNPEIIKVVLSGYTDFEYVSIAFKLGVFDYLVKPLEKNQFDLLLDKVVSTFYAYGKEKKQNYLQNVLTLKKKTEDISSVYQILLLNIGACGAQNLDFPEMYLRIWEEINLLERMKEIFPCCEYHIVAGKKEAERVVFIEGLSIEFSVVQKIFLSINPFVNYLTVVFFQNTVEFKNIYEKYKEMQGYAAEHQLFCRSSLLVMPDQGSAYIKIARDERTDFQIEKIIAEIRYNLQYEKVATIIEKIFGCISAKPVRQQEIECMFRNFFSALCSRLPETNYFQYDQTLLEILQSYQSLENIMAQTKYLAKEILCPQSMLGRDKKTVAEAIVQYLETNYKRAISAQELSDVFGFVPAYINRIFKTFYDSTPMEYVQCLRIERAKDLLMRTKRPIKEIAAEVGYPDSLYFSKVFKRAVGVNPSLYQKRGQENGEK